MNVSSCIDIRFSVVVKEGDEICNTGRNEIYKFTTLLKYPHVMEEKYGRGKKFSREHNFLLEYENTAMKIFKLYYVIEGQVG